MTSIFGSILLKWVIAAIDTPLVYLGVRVIDGIPGLKVHAKLLLITRKVQKHARLYAAISTGMNRRFSIVVV